MSKNDVEEQLGGFTKVDSVQVGALGDNQAREAFEAAKEELVWLKKTAKDPQDLARVVGFEDCLRSWQASRATLPKVTEAELVSLDIRKLLQDMDGAFSYIEQYLGYCIGQEIGLHRAGDVNPYYVSWSDGEFFISTSWAHAKQARAILAKFPFLRGE